MCWWILDMMTSVYIGKYVSGCYILLRIKISLPLKQKVIMISVKLSEIFNTFSIASEYVISQSAYYWVLSRCQLNMEDESTINVYNMQYGTAYILYITHHVSFFFLANTISLCNTYIYISLYSPGLIG